MVRSLLKAGALLHFIDVFINWCIIGEGGEPVYTSMAEKSAVDRSVREFGFNMLASDKIAMDRNIPDTRLDE